MDFESLRIVFKPERNHRVQYVLAADRLALLQLALLRRLGRDETDKLRHAFLHALLGVLRDFGRWRYGILHDTRDVCDLRHRRHRRRRRRREWGGQGKEGGGEMEVWGLSVCADEESSRKGGDGRTYG